MSSANPNPNPLIKCPWLTVGWINGRWWNVCTPLAMPQLGSVLSPKIFKNLRRHIDVFWMALHTIRLMFFALLCTESQIRMRRLNERNQDYLESLERLQKKCMVSGFDERMTTRMIDLAKTWTSRFGPTNLRPESSSNTERLTWATSDPRSLRVSRKEKELQPTASITYKRPPTLGVFLTNYRKLAFHQSNNQT